MGTFRGRLTRPDARTGLWEIGQRNAPRLGNWNIRVEPVGVCAKETLHSDHQIRLGRLHHQMKMVRHEAGFFPRNTRFPILLPSIILPTSHFPAFIVLNRSRRRASLTRKILPGGQVGHAADGSESVLRWVGSGPGVQGRFAGGLVGKRTMLWSGRMSVKGMPALVCLDWAWIGLE